MNQFCKEVIKFLHSEYNDAYIFELERRCTIAKSWESDDIELIIKINPNYKIKIPCGSMNHIFELYKTGDYIEERKQYLWQKELIDMIEGS
jgi:hypothetical protein